MQTNRTLAVVGRHVFAALCAFAAIDQVAAQSSVTLYGAVDAGLQYVHTEANVPTAKTTLGIDSGIGNGTRWGIRGAEDLGGGVRAVFLLESGFSTDTGALPGGGRLFHRWAYVGLAGGFGEIRLGRQSAFGFEMFSPVSPFGTIYGDAGSAATFSSQAALRFDNMIAYRSPALGPIRFNIGGSTNVAATEVAGLGNNTSALTAGIQGNFGPVLAVVTYELLNCPNSSPVAGVGTCSVTTKEDQTHLQIGAVVDLKFLKIHAGFALEENQFGFGPRRFGIAQSTTAASNDAKSWLAGLTVPVGPANVLLSYQNRNVDRATCSTTAGTGICDGRVAAIGATYPFSRRTSMYAYFSDADAKNTSNNLNDRREGGVGLVHQF